MPPDRLQVAFQKLLRRVAIPIAMLSMNLACAELPAVSRVQRARTLDYDPKVPIASRLTRDDDLVRVIKHTFPPLRAHNINETLDEAVTHATLYDVIVVVNGLTRSGTLINGGTWIQSSVNASLIELLKGGGGIEPRAKHVTFWHDDGEMTINQVLVRAGTYPVYSSQKTYLLLLNHDPSRGLYAGRSLEVNSRGVLIPIERSNGEIPARSTALYDQPLVTVLSKLRQRLSK